MKNGDKVREYVSMHEEPVQEAMPQFSQKWATASGQQYWHSRTCSRSSIAPSGGFVKAPGNGYFETIYIHYIPEYDMLEFALVEINNNGRHRDNEVFKWEYISERLFLVKGDTHPYNSLGMKYCPDSNGSYYNREFVEILTLWDRTHNGCYEYHLQDELSKFCGDRMSLYQFANEYYINISRNKDLLEPLGDLTEMAITHVSAMQRAGDHSYMVPAGIRVPFYEKLSEKCSVIRFVRIYCEDGNSIDIRAYEFFRMYVCNHKIKLYEKGHVLWKKTTTCPYTIDGCQTGLHNYKAEFLKCKEISYVYKIAEAIKGSRGLLETICQLINHPVIERLYKAGYRNIALHLLHNPYSTCFQKMFGKSVNEKAGIFKATGCNRTILSLIDGNIPRYSKVGVPLKICRELYGEDFLHFNLEKLTKCLNVFRRLSECAMLHYCNWKSIIPGGDTIEGCRSFAQRLVKLGDGDVNIAIATLADIHDMYLAMHMDYDATVADMLHTARDIYNLHDRMMQLYNHEALVKQQKQVLDRNEALQKLQETRREKFNYENDEYLIRVPESIDEIIYEGSMLHHCVASYCDRHAKGNTNILFLRRKETPNVPFYTIEVQKGRVIQIHGWSNRWLGCNPEAIPFVYEWIKKIGVSCSKGSLLSQSTGYKMTGPMLDESYLYDEKITLTKTA